MAQEKLAKYCQAKPVGKREAAQLTSSNSLVGDKFKLDFNPKKKAVKIKNKFGFAVASLGDADSKTIKLWINKGLEVVALLSYVAYNEPKAQHFAEFLIFAYPKKEADAYEKFINTVGKKLASGYRPDIKLDDFERKEIVKSMGNYKLDKMLPKPKLEKGCATVKNKRGFMDSLIEAGRNRNPGCFIISILFLLAIAALIIFIFFI